MMKRLSRLLYLALFLAVCGFASEASAQNRKAVSAAEVNGTFRMYFTGRFKDLSNEIKILALGKGRLKVSFDLIYPYFDGTGGLAAHVGTAQGVATIAGDTAVYTDDKFGQCRITIKFVKPGEIRVKQESDSGGCGFGHNVAADGTYRKTSAAKPKFEER